MPNVHALLQPSALWFTLTRLGETQLMLPSALVLVAWLASIGERRTAVLWLQLLSLAVGLTTASKIAFIGWGIGIARLNFTGFSGHAMYAAVVFPLLLRCVAVSGTRQTQHLAVSFGYALAALVAISRIVVGAHSSSEAAAGFVLGAAASALALAFGPVLQRPLPRWLLGLLLAAQLVNPAALPSMPTHDMVTRLALEVSGHERPYTRGMMLRRERERLKALQAASAHDPQSTCAPAHGGGCYSASAVVFLTSSITA